MVKYPIPIGDIHYLRMIEQKEYFIIYGPQCFPSIIRCKIVDGNIWGYSVYLGEPAYRTLGCNFHGWVKLNDVIAVFDSGTKALNYLKSLLTETIPISEWESY